VSLVPCIGHDHCAPLETVKKAMFGAKLDFLYLNAFVDFESYDTEIQQLYIDDSLFISVNPNETKEANVYVKKAEVLTQDKLIQLGELNQDNYSFHQVEKIREYSLYRDPESADPLMNIFIRMDNAYDVNERQIYSIMDFFGDFGGVIEVLMILGNVFVSFIASNKFYAAMIRQIYEIKTYTSQKFVSSKGHQRFLKNLKKKSKKLIAQAKDSKVGVATGQ